MTNNTISITEEAERNAQPRVDEIERLRAVVAQLTLERDEALALARSEGMRGDCVVDALRAQDVAVDIRERRVRALVRVETVNAIVEHTREFAESLRAMGPADGPLAHHREGAIEALYALAERIMTAPPKGAASDAMDARLERTRFAVRHLAQLSYGAPVCVKVERVGTRYAAAVIYRGEKLRGPEASSEIDAIMALGVKVAEHARTSMRAFTEALRAVEDFR